jgi:GntR family transcriptional regulator
MESEEPLIRFRLDARTGLAPYRQLVDQVAQAVRMGSLRAGDRLPSVREVVTQISINPNTVHRAYRELEAMTLVEARPGLGTFVAESAMRSINPKRQVALEAELRRWIGKARNAGMDDEGILGLVANSIHKETDSRRSSDND